MLIFAFMAINLAWIQKNYVDGQVASDLGSRWGVDLASRVEDASTIKEGVKEIVSKNWTLNSPSKHSSMEVELGSARPNPNGKGMKFVKDAEPINSVRVTSNANIATVGFMSQSKRSSGIELGRRSTAVALERDICVVVDRSGSMNFDLDTATWSTDNSRHPDNPLSNSRYYNHRRYAYQYWWYWPHPSDSRWSTMVPALYGLADELGKTAQNESFSIVSYSTSFNYRFYDPNLRIRNFRGNSSSIESNPTFDYKDAVDHLKHKYNEQQVVAGGTNISAGIDLAVKVLTGDNSRPNAFKTIIVMTDGQYNNGRHPSLAASDAADENIEVFTVTFSHQADQKVMRETAEEGNGRHFHAPDGETLEEVFRQIANIPPAAYIE